MGVEFELGGSDMYFHPVSDLVLVDLAVDSRQGQVGMVRIRVGAGVLLYVPDIVGGPKFPLQFLIRGG